MVWLDKNTNESFATVKAVQEKLEAVLGHETVKVGIADNQGIVVIFTDPSSTGKFSEPAYKAIQTGRPVVVDRTNEFLFVASQQGVYVPFFHEKEAVGVILLVGDPELLAKYAGMAALTAQSVYDLESYKASYWGKLDQRNIFTKVLLYYSEDPYPAEAYNIADKYGYDTDMVRIPLLFILRYSYYREDRQISEFERNPYHDKQDIICITRGQNAVVFKAVSTNPAEAVGRYREVVEQYVEGMQALNLNGGRPFICNVGTLQNKLINYQKGYHHSLWVSNNSADVIGDDETRIYYFYDSVLPYLQSQVPMEEFSMIFNVFKDVLKGGERQRFLDNMGMLYQRNMNVSASAKALFQHRNTLIAWINRMKELFCLDPVNDEIGREFFQQLLYYYKNTED